MWHTDNRFDIFITNGMEKYVNYYTIFTGFSMALSFNVFFTFDICVGVEAFSL